MSMDLMVKVMKLKVGNPLRKLVLLKLADNANDAGESWPSFQHLADQCEISRRSVIAHVDALCAAGLLRKEYRTGPKGNSSNVYHFTLNGAANSPAVSGGAQGDSAEDSPGGGAGNSLHGEGDAPPSAGDSPGGGAGAEPRISHSFEPVIEPVKEPKECQADELPDDLDDPALRVLNHFNRTTGAKFQTGQTTMGFINGLLVGEYVADELILVIDHRNELWSADPKMSQHLCPKTLFNFENFEGYLPLARKWDEEGRLSSREPEIDATERDSAYGRFLGRGLVLMPKSALEIHVRKLASHAGVKNQSPEISKRTWDRLWAESEKTPQVESRKN